MMVTTKRMMYLFSTLLKISPLIDLRVSMTMRRYARGKISTTMTTLSLCLATYLAFIEPILKSFNAIMIGFGDNLEF